MNSKRLLYLTLMVLVLVAFGSGYTVGAYRLRQCQKRNTLLFNDLSYAVGRGVWLEAHLKRCQEGDK